MLSDLLRPITFPSHTRLVKSNTPILFKTNTSKRFKAAIIWCACAIRRPGLLADRLCHIWFLGNGHKP
jgi:hypothetical protein